MAQDRRAWTWGVAEDAEAMERADDAFWLELDPAERLALVYELSASFDWSEDDEEDDVPRRVLGADCGVRSGVG